MSEHLSLEVPRRPLYLVFDVESVGLHGEGFAVGWVYLDASTGIHIDRGLAWCNPDKVRGGSSADREWVYDNVPPLLQSAEVHHKADVRARFWRVWRKARAEGAWLAADVAWPVEARFLFDCIDDAPHERAKDAPYPLIDIASVRFGLGMNPLASERRLEHELPAHNPLCDAWQSARLLHEALQFRGRLSDRAIDTMSVHELAELLPDVKQRLLDSQADLRAELRAHPDRT